MLRGESSYIEVYKVLEDSNDMDADIKELVELSYKLLNTRELLSEKVMLEIKKIIGNINCKTRKDILISEILNSITIINESLSAKNNEVLVGNLGLHTDKHKYEDELKYLHGLICVIKGEREYRFSLALKADKIIYTNIFLI